MPLQFEHLKDQTYSPSLFVKHRTKVLLLYDNIHKAQTTYCMEFNNLAS